MAANTRLATAIQILCVVAHEAPRRTNSGTVSSSLLTNTVVVLRMLKMLEAHGLVALRQGRDGGVQLGRPAGAITLQDIRAAIEDEPEVFALRPGGNPDCPVNTRMNDLLAPIFASVDRSVADTIGRVTLADLMRGIPEPAP